MWPEEAAAVQESGRSLTELRSVGPFTANFIAVWLREPPDPPVPPPLRDGFITYAYARMIVEAHPEWSGVTHADHQMHTDETDGSSTIEEMVEAAGELGRERIAITDHSKTLRLTNGMDEVRLRAIWIPRCSLAWTSFSERSTRSSGCATTRPSGISAVSRTLISRCSRTLADASTTFARASPVTGSGWRGARPTPGPRSRSTHIRTARISMWSAFVSSPGRAPGSRSARMLTLQASSCSSRSESPRRSSRGSPATAYSTSFLRVTSPTESV